MSQQLAAAAWVSSMMRKQGVHTVHKVGANTHARARRVCAGGGGQQRAAHQECV